MWRDPRRRAVRRQLRALLLAWLLLPGAAAAQQATERFVPIGRSPGLSGEHTLRGRIEAVDPVRRTLRLSTAAGPREVTVGRNTRIWLDRTSRGESNLSGTLEDCGPGREVEVRPASDPQLADWVKVGPVAR